MSLIDGISALATRVGQEIKSVRDTMAADSAVVHKSGDETVAGIKTFSSAPVVPLGAASGNPVRRDDARLSDARTPTSHSHAFGDLSGVADASHTHAASPRTVTYAGSITLTPLSGVDVDRVNITATGGPTITPGTGADGQIIRLAVLASGAQRVVTIAASVRLSTGITVRTLTIPQNQAGVIGLEYVGLLGAWVLFAAYVTST